MATEITYVYHYDPVSGVYKGRAVGRRDPLDKERIVCPLHATFLQPPDLAANEVAVFNGTNWSATTIDPGGDPDPVEVPLEQQKIIKKGKVWTAFESASKRPVLVEGVLFDGGWMSVIKMFLAIELAKEDGITARKFYSTDETERTLAIDGDGLTGRAVLFGIARDLDSKDALLRSKLIAVEAAQSAEDLAAIDLSFDPIVQIEEEA